MLPDEGIADFKVQRDIAMANIFLAFYICGAHWRHPVNANKRSMCGGNVTLCQITSTTCLWSPYGIGQTIYIFMMWFVLSFFFFFLA